MAVAASDCDGLVTVTPQGRFELRGEPYRFLGANYFYGPMLGAPIKGDRQRLAADLDSLQALGINNLRVLVGAEGSGNQRSHIEPNLQTAPGIYDNDLLQGLDHFLAELERRDMRAVLYLTNAWEWSGGYGQYLVWSGAEQEAPTMAGNGYHEYCRRAAQFLTDSTAQALFRRHVVAIVSRTNSITGQPYATSPAIMAWQICNEPRAFRPDNKPLLAQWIHSTAELIKSLDPNHLLSTGSEGEIGCEGDLGLWRDMHADSLIDYATIHIWPYNFQWVSDSTLATDLPKVKKLTKDYVKRHAKAIRDLRKPLVLEEFGYPRDGHSFSPTSSTKARDSFYAYVFRLLKNNNSPLQGVNFWGWSGTALPRHKTWQPGDPLLNDPAHEPQGFYSVWQWDTTVKLFY